MYYVKLRNNIELEGDLTLAEYEVTSLFEEYEPIYKNDKISWIPDVHVNSYCRSEGLIGFLCKKNKIPLNQIIKLTSFIQEIWTSSEQEEKSYVSKVDGLYCIIPFMAMCEIMTNCKHLDESSSSEITDVLASGKVVDKLYLNAVTKSLSSNTHLHQIHVYKAKFFPRFVRSLIVSNLDLNNIEDKTICDPFMGSGTAVVECSLMGMQSIGMDIDPLSCFIAKVKSNFACGCEMEFESLLKHFKFPSIFNKKFEKKEMLGLKEQYESEINEEIDEINRKTGDEKTIHAIALSDALTRKFNIRMMGTGCGRFALEIRTTPIHSMVQKNILVIHNMMRILELLKRDYKIRPVKANVMCLDSTKREIDKKVDLIVTSPPYVPSSSGREDYLIGKLISSTALGFIQEGNVDSFSKCSMGSMDSDDVSDLDNLPESVKNLYEWLLQDKLRCIKAKPIVSYYSSIRNSLKKDLEMIKDDGKVVYIIGKKSIFYNFTTKKVVYTIECDKIFKEIASQVGFDVVNAIDVELKKRNKNARPRSIDQYYETAIVLKKRI